MNVQKQKPIVLKVNSYSALSVVTFADFLDIWIWKYLSEKPKVFQSHLLKKLTFFPSAAALSSLRRSRELAERIESGDLPLLLVMVWKK